MSIITLTERVPVAPEDDYFHVLTVQVLLPGVSINVAKGAEEPDPAEVRISWEDLEDIEAVADKFLFSTVILFKTLVPMLIKAKQLRNM